jgi:hypothetical protein
MAMAKRVAHIERRRQHRRRHRGVTSGPESSSSPSQKDGKRWDKPGAPPCATGCICGKHLVSGPANPRWRGGEVGIRGLHLRIEATRGKGRHELCVDCGGWADEWSYCGGAPDERPDPKDGAPYSLDFTFYAPRCRRCHMKFDKKKETHDDGAEGEAQ